MKQLSNNVYVETNWTSGSQASAGSNSSFVVTSEGVVMVDSPLVPSNAIKWRNTISEAGNLIFLINTEYHADHVLGNYFFSTRVIAHEKTRTAIPESLGSAQQVRGKVQKDYPADVRLMESYQIRMPTITFSQRLELHLGKHTFELLHLPGHTLGQIGVYVPEEKVVFTGDNFSNGFQPALSYSYPLEWLDSLDKIMDLDVEVIVPGHGEAGNKKDLEQFRNFLDYCIERVRGAIRKGMSKHEAMEELEFEELLTPRHPGREQQKRNISRLYEMLANRE